MTLFSFLESLNLRRISARNLCRGTFAYRLPCHALRLLLIGNIYTPFHISPVYLIIYIWDIRFLLSMARKLRENEIDKEVTNSYP